MLKTLLQLHSVNLRLSINSTYPISLSSGKKFTDREKMSLLHRELFALPLSVVPTATPKTLLGSNFSAKCLLEELRQVLFRHMAAA